MLVKNPNLTLLVEIGGTHTRCGIAHDGAGPDRIAVFHNADHSSLSSVIETYLDDFAGDATLRRAALAVAAPVDGERLELTNLGWAVDSRQLVKRFGWSDAAVINDFEALACAVPALSADELLVIQTGAPAPDAPRAILGPGTGLGVSGLIPCGAKWYPISGEGGHVTLAAHDDRETDVLTRLRRKCEHVSAERILSGPGLLTLYKLLADHPGADSPLEVTRLASAGDERALQALELFFRFLGTVSGDLALTLGARGGVYLGGGILPMLKQQLMESGFVRRFSDKGRFSDYLKPIPVYLILAEAPALRGLIMHPHVQYLIRGSGSR